jgi:hypothetical protein
MRKFSDWNQGPVAFSRKALFGEVRYESAMHWQCCGKSGSNYRVVVPAEWLVRGVDY